MTTTSLAIEARVTGDGTPALTVHCTAKNISGQPIHVFASKRMPYLLDEQGALVALHGVSPPPTDRNLNGIEIPATRALAPGESLVFDVPLLPLRVHDHYSDEPAPPRHGPATVVCRIGHGTTPIDAAAQMQMAIDGLLAWQRLESSSPIAVQLP